MIYCRVSTQEQRDEGYSIEAQLGVLTAYCAAKGITVVQVIEESETAKSSGRPGFQQLLALIKSGSANCVVVEKTDRLYRNLRDRVLLDDLCPEIHLVKENTVLSPTSKSHEKFMHDIKLVVAKNYIDNLREETIKGMTEKAKAGLWPSHAPTGYINASEGSRRIIIPEPGVAGKIQRIFELYATGDYSFDHLSREAVKIGLKSRLGRAYGKSGIQAMLRNPLYAGIVRWNGIDYEGVHQAVVDRQLWNRCQLVMDGRNPTSVPRTQQEFTYKGLIRCASCGSLMSPYMVRKPNGREFRYYACPGAKGCKRVNYREEWITDQFASMLGELRLSSQALALLRKALQGSFSAIASEDKKTTEFLTARKTKLQESLENLYLDKLAGDTPAELFERIKTKLMAEIAEVDADLARADAAKLATWEQTADFVESVSNSSVRFLEADSAAKRQMFKSAISNCQIGEGKLLAEREFWFKLMTEGALQTPESPSENEVRTSWLPIVSDLLTAGIIAA